MRISSNSIVDHYGISKSVNIISIVTYMHVYIIIICKIYLIVIQNYP